MSVTLLADDKDDNEVKRKTMISLHLLYGCEKLRKTSARRPSEGCATAHCHKWGPLPPNEVGRIAHHTRDRDREDGRKEIN